MGGRSVSAVDTAAAQRARARAAYSQITRHRPALGTASLRNYHFYFYIIHLTLDMFLKWHEKF